MEKTFAQEVDEGFSADPKYLSSKYHYDDEGSLIFQEIMSLPEYYLTRCELDILQNRAMEIYQETGFSGHFNIVELGAGDGMKTKAFLKNLLEAGADFTYVPIDISEAAIHLLETNMKAALPELKISSYVGDYFEVMDEMETKQRCPNLILFLGANIGNFKPQWALDLMKHIQEHMRSGDKLLVGFDLKKDPHLITNAYADSQGITARFNLNVLNRINRELKGDFNTDNFNFYSFYDPETGNVKSYLYSLTEQQVHIAHLKKTFHFKKHEFVWMELSKKYAPLQIEKLGIKAGFMFRRHFLDSKRYFSDSLFEKP